MNIVVIVVKVFVANVLDLVLENRVKMIRTADQMNLVVLMEHARSIVLENFVSPMETVHQVNPVVVILLTKYASQIVLENRVTPMATVPLDNVVITIRNVKQEIATRMFLEIILYMA